MKKFIVPIMYIFVFMMMVGFSENMRGPFVTLFKSEFGVNDVYISILFTISSVAYIMFQYIGGRLVQRFTTKFIYLASLITITVSFFIMYMAPNYTVLVIALFIFNAGISLFSITTNTLVPFLFAGYQAVLMNITHFCYGFGTTLGQRFAGVMLEKGVTWRNLNLLNGILFLILIALFFFVKFPSPHVDGDRNSKYQRLKFSEIISNKIVILYIAAIGFYVFAEVGVANWFSNFLIDSYGFNKDRSSLYLSLFFGIFAFGRLIGGFIVEKLGHFKSLTVFMPVALILFTSGLLGGESLIYLISFSGFFFSIAFPTLVLTVNKVFKENASYVLGTIMTFSSAVNMLLNLSVGSLNSAFGTYRAFFIIPLSLSISILAVIFIIKNTNSIKKAGMM